MVLAKVDEKELSAGQRLGQGLRQYVAPIYTGIADVATMAPRFLGHTTGEVISGMRGEPGGRESFTAFPFTKGLTSTEVPVEAPVQAPTTALAMRRTEAAPKTTTVVPPAVMTPSMISSPVAPTASVAEAPLEIIPGFRGAPSLREPFVDPARFRSHIGYDKDGNALYSTGAEEMAAANQAISNYNTARLNSYAQERGIIPKSLAQAGLFEVQAEVLPETTESQIGLRGAQKLLAERQSKQPIFFTEDVPTGGRDINLKPTTVSKPRFYDPIEQTSIDPTQGLRTPRQQASAQLRALFSGMSKERQAIVSKHMAENPSEEPTSILAKLRSGAL